MYRVRPGEHVCIALSVQVLLPLHPGLGRLLMSRHVAIQVLERQADFLNSIEEAGG